MNNKFVTNSFEETRAIGKKIAQSLKSTDILALYGDLGSGKTTFIQGLAEGLGIKRRIISPTFIIVRHYKLKKGNFYHLDLYRTNSVNDLESLGITEILSGKNNIIAVEWAKNLLKFLPKKRLDLNFKYLDENKREIIIKKINE